jgi:hypothetical protein
MKDFLDNIKTVYADKAYNTRVRDFIAKLDIYVHIPKNIRNNKRKEQHKRMIPKRNTYNVMW